MMARESLTGEQQRVSSTIEHGSTIDRGTQTLIRVYPHVLQNVYDTATAVSDKKSQTIVAIKHGDRTDTFNSLLSYMPFQDIRQEYQRIVDLPKKPKLVFKTATAAYMRLDPSFFSLADDDGVGMIINEFLTRRMSGGSSSCTTTRKDVEVQTTISVFPDILQEGTVASVMSTGASQTPCTWRRKSW